MRTEPPAAATARHTHACGVQRGKELHRSMAESGGRSCGCCRLCHAVTAAAASRQHRSSATTCTAALLRRCHCRAAVTAAPLSLPRSCHCRVAVTAAPLSLPRRCHYRAASASASPVQHIHLCEEHGVNDLPFYVGHREPVARCVEHQAAVPKARLVRHCGGQRVWMQMPMPMPV